MTIEKTLERIADALETIAAGGGIATPDAPAKPGGRKTSQTRVVGKPAEPDPDGPTKEEVRAKLQELQKATTPARAKSLLKENGASTIGNLPAVKYQKVIDEVNALLEG